jgi:hypothetical protein
MKGFQMRASILWSRRLQSFRTWSELIAWWLLNAFRAEIRPLAALRNFLSLGAI